MSTASPARLRARWMSVAIFGSSSTTRTRTGSGCQAALAGLVVSDQRAEVHTGGEVGRIVAGPVQTRVSDLVGEPVELRAQVWRHRPEDRQADAGVDRVLRGVRLSRLSGELRLIETVQRRVGLIRGAAVVALLGGCLQRAAQSERLVERPLDGVVALLGQERLVLLAEHLPRLLLAVRLQPVGSSGARGGAAVCDATQPYE